MGCFWCKNHKKTGCFCPCKRVVATTPPNGHLWPKIKLHALRMHQASAGGNFIEPLDGRPRIVQGTVLAIDPSSNEVVVDLVVPFRLSIADGQAPAMFTSGEMVNFYVEPGCRFETD